jgi:3'(2'), 5'-bisphosphate nucleotidase
MSDILNLVPDLLRLAKTASSAILTIYQQSSALDIQTKLDDTPLTQADLQSNTILVEGLSKLTPDYPILSEESDSVSFAERQSWQRYWLIDPLDGTQSFIKQTGEFCICVALIESHQAIFGLLYVPTTGRCMYGIAGEGAFEVSGDSHTPIRTRLFNEETAVLTLTRSRNTDQDHFLKQQKSQHIMYCNSAIKFMLVASGEADVYPRFGPTSEWDTAAGQCIIEAAGGRMCHWDGERVEYNRKDSLLNAPFIAMGDKSYQIKN